VDHSVERKEVPTLSDQLRFIFRHPLKTIGAFLHKLGVKANYVTFIGVIGTAIGSVLVAVGRLTEGGLIILVSSGVDALDGAVARARGESEVFGAFVDSVSDRYSELMIFGGLLWYFVEQENYAGAVITFLAAGGSLMVSYVRARAQSLGFEAKVGILTRLERIIVIGPTIVFRIPMVGVAIVAILANITAFQRIVYVRRQAHQQAKNKITND
jgi:CDP-diacylglycerol--glycerol-3-phosphate 3-phosphatidyltransferase